MSKIVFIVFDQKCNYDIISAMLFSDKGVDPNLISWNRVVLLHGPPGTVMKMSIGFRNE